MNNDKLQNPPYLIEALKQIDDSRQSNYSLLALDGSKKQIVTLASINSLDDLDSHHLGAELSDLSSSSIPVRPLKDKSIGVNGARMNGLMAGDSGGMSIEGSDGSKISALSESSSDTSSMSLPTSDGKNSLTLDTNLSRKSPNQLPVTSSHLKKPFTSSNDDDSNLGDDNMNPAEITGDDPIRNNKPSKYLGRANASSAASPSVATDESLSPSPKDLLSSVLASPQSTSSFSSSSVSASRDGTLSVNVGEPISDDSTSQIKRQLEVRGEALDESRESSFSETNPEIISMNQNQVIPSVALANETSKTVKTKSEQLDCGSRTRTRVVSGAGNQLLASSSSSVSLTGGLPSTDLSPLPEDGVELDEQVTWTNGLIPAEEATVRLQSQSESEPESELNSPPQISEHETTGHQQLQSTRRKYRRPPNRIVEIPEKIVVTADSQEQQISKPIRLVVNKTRLGKPDSRCPNVGVTTLEHPSACDKYFYCEDGYLIEQTCPNGLMYGTVDTIKDYCVHRWHANCVDKVIPNPISSPGCRWQYGIFSVQGSPRCAPDFYECIAGRFEIKKCSIAGQVYDDRTKSCQFADKVGCPGEILSDFSCPQDDRTNSFWPFPRYYLDEKTLIHCINEKPKVIRCSEGERVDLEHLHCVPMSHGDSIVDRRVREKQKGHQADEVEGPA